MEFKAHFKRDQHPEAGCLSFFVAHNLSFGDTLFQDIQQIHLEMRVSMVMLSTVMARRYLICAIFV